MLLWWPAMILTYCFLPYLNWQNKSKDIWNSVILIRGQYSFKLKCNCVAIARSTLARAFRLLHVQIRINRLNFQTRVDATMFGCSCAFPSVSMCLHALYSPVAHSSKQDRTICQLIVWCYIIPNLIRTSELYVENLFFTI